MNALQAILRADPTVTSIVGAHVYSTVLPQPPAMPADAPGVTWLCDDEQTVNHQGGAEGAIDSVYIVTSWAQTYEQCRTLAGAVRSALHWKHGVYAGVGVDLIKQTNARDDYTPPQDGSGQGRRSVDTWFAVSYRP